MIQPFAVLYGIHGKQAHFVYLFTYFLISCYIYCKALNFVTVAENITYLMQASLGHLRVALQALKSLSSDD